MSFFFSIFAADSQLVPEDPESKKDDFAFDNPAFKTGDGGAHNASKVSGSPLDPSWTSSSSSAAASPANKQNSLDKRKTVDDSCVQVSQKTTTDDGARRVVLRFWVFTRGLIFDDIICLSESLVKRMIGDWKSQDGVCGNR